MTRFAITVAAALLATPAVATAEGPKPTAKTPARPQIYDTKADAAEQLKKATALARRDSRRVLVMFGFNTCGWCHKLHRLFENDKDIHKLLADEYVVSMIDNKAPNAESILNKAKEALSKEERERGVGYPFLPVFDGDGRVVTAQRTDPLEEGDHHNPGRVKAFLEKWVAPKVAAAKVLEEGLAKASSEDKRVFLHFGSPTCGWCHKLEAFLSREDIAPIIGREFVDVKLDLSRMTGAQDILKKFNPSDTDGVPWFVLLDSRGEPIVTSNGPKGNIGYPVSSHEIAHFTAMLKQASRKLDSAQIETIERALKADAKKIEAARTASTAGH